MFRRMRSYRRVVLCFSLAVIIIFGFWPTTQYLRRYCVLKSQTSVLTADDHTKRPRPNHPPAAVKDVSPRPALVSGQTSEGHFKIHVYDRDAIILGTLKTQELVEMVNSNEGRRLKCYSSNRRTIDLSLGDENSRHFQEADAVVFNFGSIDFPKNVLPADMNPNQTWVMFTTEPPLKVSPSSSYRLSEFAFNAIWTYHRYSEINGAFGFYKRGGVPMTQRRKSAEEWVLGRTKLIAWVASNCYRTSWPRLDYVNELKRHVPVDTYGICGSSVCLRTAQNCTDENLIKRYKFYLSLENAECDDYISEKVWERPLRYGAVPIVYGARRECYEQLLPPRSFIYIGDFKTPKELADYLKRLDTNPQLYAEYLEWRYTGSVTANNWRTSHSLCNVVPIIQRVKRGELKRKPLGQFKYYPTCRNGTRIQRYNKISKVAKHLRIENWKSW